MLLKVSNKTEPKKLAGAILGAMRENGGSVDLQAIGAGAVNQAIKAIAIVRNILNGNGSVREVKVVPGFVDVELGDKQLTGIRFTVFAS